MSHVEPTTPALHGLMAEFESVDSLLRAAERTQAAGYTKKDAFSPFPIHGLAEALGFRERSVAPIVLAGGLAGLAAGWGLEYWTSVIDYPMNVGGRPYNAWVNFIPPAFETTILFASFAAVIGMLTLNGLPRPYHPVFNVKRFERASQDTFFLVIEATDPKFDLENTRAFLTGLGAKNVVTVDE
jgi:Protein of unknown function (DUF3341)